MLPKFYLLIVIVLISGCQSTFEGDTSVQIPDLENLAIYPADMEPASEIRLVRERTFGGTDEDVIGIGTSIAIDGDDRVFIGDAAKHSVHLFLPDGSYVTTIGREGRGPGEFTSPPFPVILFDRLYLYDAMQRRVSIYLTDTLEHLQTINLDPGNQGDMDDLAGYSISQIHFRKDGKFLAAFRRHYAYFSMEWSRTSHVQDGGKIKYYLIDRDGRILPDKIFDQPGTKFLTAIVRGEFRDVLYPYFGKPLLAVSEEGNMYSAWSQDFLIEIRDPSGKYLRAIYYPLEKRAYSRKEEEMRRRARVNMFGQDSRVLDLWRSIFERVPDNNLPEAWPVLNSILVDDEDRLWVSVLTGNVEEYEWWVLKNSGELLARFSWPINREVRVVKNGYVYSQEIDKDSGSFEFVRYRIEMTEAE